MHPYIPGTPGTPGTSLIYIRILRICPAHTPAQTRHRRIARANTSFFTFKKIVMKENQTQPGSRTIRCTPENARAMAAAVKAWPELHTLVQDLQAQNLFPGLRSLQITLTGPDALLDKGIAAVAEINASRAV